MSSKEFEYSLHDISSLVVIPFKLNENSFTKKSYLSQGSSAVVFTGNFRNEKVVIKVSKGDTTTDGEVEMEHYLLERLCHPNIIQIRGAGYCPRKFILLEYIDGGCLHELLEKRRSSTKKSVLSLFKRVIPLLSLQEVIGIALQMVQAIHYLHETWHPDAAIIHRDLKPQNIAITAKGLVKLIDFGLTTCIKKRTLIGEVYQLTGNVGSLRYMAAEVALHQPYNEKVDIYSLGMILWEMSSGRVFCDGMGKEDYIEKVVRGGLRPDLKGVHIKMARLISNCLDANASNRPNCEQIIDTLNDMKHLK